MKAEQDKELSLSCRNAFVTLCTPLYQLGVYNYRAEHLKQAVALATDTSSKGEFSQVINLLKTCLSEPISLPELKVFVKTVLAASLNSFRKLLTIANIIKLLNIINKVIENVSKHLYFLIYFRTNC